MAEFCASVFPPLLRHKEKFSVAKQKSLALDVFLRKEKSLLKNVKLKVRHFDFFQVTVERVKTSGMSDSLTLYCQTVEFECEQQFATRRAKYFGRV